MRTDSIASVSPNSQSTGLVFVVSALVHGGALIVTLVAPRATSSGGIAFALLALLYSAIGASTTRHARRDVVSLLTVACLATEWVSDTVAHLAAKQPRAGLRLLWPPTWYRYVRQMAAIDLALRELGRRPGS